jgi:hypothetical protein
VDNFLLPPWRLFCKLFCSVFLRVQGIFSLLLVMCVIGGRLQTNNGWSTDLPFGTFINLHDCSTIWFNNSYYPNIISDNNGIIIGIIYIEYVWMHYLD